MRTVWVGSRRASLGIVVGALLLAGCFEPSAGGRDLRRFDDAPGYAAPPMPGSRDPFLWPFASSSPWNVAVGSGAVFAGVGDARNVDLLDPSVGTNVNAAMWSHPVYQASVGDPVRAVTDFLGTSEYRIPESAKPALPEGGDMHMSVVDPSKRWVDESWLTRGDGSEWEAGFHRRVDLYGSGVDRGVRAAYVSTMGGLIRSWELDEGVIRHALAFAVSRDHLRVGWVWPANNEDSGASGTYGGSLPMGSFVAIPPSVDVEALGLSGQGRVVARALQDYGAYLVDATDNGGGPVVFYAEPSADGKLAAVRADMAAIRAQLRVVTNNGPDNVGGGGTPRAPQAPPPE